MWVEVWQGAGAQHRCKQAPTIHEFFLGVLRHAAACFGTLHHRWCVRGGGIPNAPQPVQSQHPPTKPPLCTISLPITPHTGPWSGGLPCSPPSRGLAVDLFGSALCCGRLFFIYEGYHSLCGQPSSTQQAVQFACILTYAFNDCQMQTI